MLEYMVYILFVIVVSVFILLVAFRYINEDIETTNLETFLLEKSLIYSDSCLSFRDTVKNYPGIVDLERVNSDVITSCFSKQNLGYLVKISDLNRQVLKSASNLDLRQELYLPVCKTVKQYKCANKNDLVLYYEKGQIKTGYISLEVINLV